MSLQRGPIGIFDSGFGGLRVARTIIEKLPAYDYLYLGDTARAPYGDRTRDEIDAFTREAVSWLTGRGASLVILACNTASSEALRTVQREQVSRSGRANTLGVLIPAAEAAVRATRGRRVGVLATTGTVRSGAYPREIAKLDPNISVYQSAAPELVPLIEAGRHDDPEISSLLQRYLDPLVRERVDTLILGCTHYGILGHRIRELLGDMTVISGEDVVADSLAGYLGRHGDIEAGITRGSTRSFYTTGDTDTFARLGSEFFGEAIGPLTVASARSAS